MAKGAQIQLFGTGVGNPKRSLNVTAASRTNVYYDIQPAPGDKSQVAAFGTPGLIGEAFGRYGVAGLIKEIYTAGIGYTYYYIIGDSFFDSSSLGVAGTMASGTQGNPEITDNYVDIVVAHGERLYAYSYIGPSTLDNIQFSGTTDDIRAETVTFMDGYVIAGIKGSGSVSPKVHISGLYDARTWNPLDFAVPEFKTDNLVKVKAHNGLLYVFGDYSTEAWQNIGDLNFPFQPIQGAKYNYGLVRKESVAQINNRLIGLFENPSGLYSIMSIEGLQFSDITPPDLSSSINEKVNNYNLRNLEQCALTYSVCGHDFYQITIQKSPGEYKTWLYDTLAGVWSIAVSGSLDRHIGRRSFVFGGNQYMTDYREESDNIFLVSEHTYTDDGMVNERELVGNHIFLPDRGMFRVNSISLDMEQGSAPLGTDMKVRLSLSRDGGHTFEEEYEDASTTGEYRRFFQFNRLGRGRDIVPKIRMTDPCKFVLIGAVADIAPYGW